MRMWVLAISIIFLAGCTEYFEHELAGEAYCNMDLNGRWVIPPELLEAADEGEEGSLTIEVFQPENCENSIVKLKLYWAEDDESIIATWQIAFKKIENRIFANIKFQELEAEGEDDEDPLPPSDTFDLLEVSVLDSTHITFYYVDSDVLKTLIDNGILHGKYENATNEVGSHNFTGDSILVTDHGSVLAGNLRNNSIVFDTEDPAILIKDVTE